MTSPVIRLPRSLSSTSSGAITSLVTRSWPVSLMCDLLRCPPGRAWSRMVAASAWSDGVSCGLGDRLHVLACDLRGFLQELVQRGVRLGHELRELAAELVTMLCDPVRGALLDRLVHLVQDTVELVLHRPAELLHQVVELGEIGAYECHGHISCHGGFRTRSPCGHTCHNPVPVGPGWSAECLTSKAVRSDVREDP